MSIRSTYHAVREYLTPVLKDSQFQDKGVLTPEEFVAAGDQLVYKCSTWAWSAGEAAARKPYLPAEKQFLVIRGGGLQSIAATFPPVPGCCLTPCRRPPSPVNTQCRAGPAWQMSPRRSFETL